MCVIARVHAVCVVLSGHSAHRGLCDGARGGGARARGARADGEREIEMRERRMEMEKRVVVCVCV